MFGILFLLFVSVVMPLAVIISFIISLLLFISTKRAKNEGRYTKSQIEWRSAAFFVSTGALGFLIIIMIAMILIDSGAISFM